MDKKDIVLWSEDYLLSWSDFKSEPNPAVFQDSLSTITYHPTWTVNSEMIQGKVFYLIETIQLDTQFLRHLSWVREQQATNQLLKHEQGHFDLAESFKHKIIAELKQKLIGKKFPTRGQNDDQRKQFAREDSGMIISKELDLFTKELEKLRETYDEETEYGANLEKQKSYSDVFDSLRN
jgi:hypothetical protein